MLPPIPVLADYGISAKHGFLPDELPLARLPDPYYNKWEAVVANLQALILSRRLRGVVDRLPVLSTSGLEHVAEWRRAYCILCFMAHGYVWGDDRPSDRLPMPLAVPLLAVSARLEVPPVASFAAVCLWNYKPLFVDEGLDRLENLASLNTLTGSLDESWFYLVSVAMEARGGPMIAIMLAAMAAARDHPDDDDDDDDDDDNAAATVTACLCAFAERLDDLAGLLTRLHERCDPTIFYHRIRPFLAGSKNMADAGLPHGLIYDDGSGRDVYRQYSGGSNAQSSLIQFFDIVLGVEHRPTGESREAARAPDEPTATPTATPTSTSTSTSTSTAPRHNFIMEMRQYMPGPHARFLRDVAAVANIRPFVLARPADHRLAIAYDACLSMLRALRDRHIAIVTRYIVVPSREAQRVARSRSRSPDVVRRQPPPQPQPQPQPQQPVNLARPADPKLLKGTGGTALIAFLKQARDETGEPAVEEWARRFLRRQARGPGKNDFFFGKPDDPSLTPEVAAATVTDDVEAIVGGMAGTWTIDDDVGGLCQY